jgi:hypothetical protein
MELGNWQLLLTTGGCKKSVGEVKLICVRRSGDSKLTGSIELTDVLRLVAASLCGLID